MQTALHSSIIPMRSTTGRVFIHLLEWDISTVKQYSVKKGFYTAEEIDAVEVEYKKYLALCAGYPKAALPTPLKFDDLWHQHILFTQDYHAMCQSACGKYIHHQPFIGNVKVDPNARAEMRAMYLSEFGEQPPSAIWSVDGLCSPNPNCEGKS